MTRSELIEELFWGFEVHSPEKIRRCSDHGMRLDEEIDGRMPIDILITMYTRSDRFGDCLQLLLDAGAQLEDQALLAVLMDDAVGLKVLMDAEDDRIHATHTIPCAFAPLEEASLLHVAAEYGRTACTEVLLTHGFDTEAKTALDKNGFGGHTPIFHTVNTHANYCRPVLELLLSHGASVDVHVKGLVWGKGMEWETLIPEVNPISYAMMGNLPQFHRDERQIAENVRMLLGHKYGEDFEVPNIPNAYLARSRKQAN